MAIEDLDVAGPWPEFEGKTLEQLVAQESWFEGERDDEANVVWLCVDGGWHKLYFDGDAVYWRETAKAPGVHGGNTDVVPEFPLADLGAEYGLAGQTLTACDGDYVDGASEVTLRFADGKSITFRNRFDRTTVAVEEVPSS